MYVHFIGIGGIGMSAIALLALKKGWKVSGSDLVNTVIIDMLKDQGAKIFDSHHEDNITSQDVVVVSTAIKNENKELVKANEKGLKIFHRSDFLQLLSKDYKQIMITGAHGKTTTTALTSHLLKTANLNPSYAVGGLLKNLPHADLGQGEYFVFEGDESDGSFLKSNPEFVIFTNVDIEHMDYWKSFESLLDGFKKVFEKVEDKKKVFYSIEDKYLPNLCLNGSSYGLNELADICPQFFNFDSKGCHINIEGHEIYTLLYGEHNIKNILAVYSLAKKLNIPIDIIKKAFSTFQGVHRRFEKIGEIDATQFIDDYAHHPVEIAANIKVLEKLTSLDKVLIIFQPHRYSRFHELLDQFIKVFENCRSLVFLPVYSAGETKIDGIEKIFIENVKVEKLYQLDLFNIQSWLELNAKNYDWVITLGAGNVTNIGRDFVKRHQVYVK